jgi:hypothetical protein
MRHGAREEQGGDDGDLTELRPEVQGRSIRQAA